MNEKNPNAVTPETVIREHPGYRYRGSDNTQYQIFTKAMPKFPHQTNGATLAELRGQGLSDDEIGDQFDKSHKEAIERHSKEFWEQVAEDPESLTREDPLAGDVDPTGGYYEEPPNPMDAHRDEVARQHGD